MASNVKQLENRLAKLRAGLAAVHSTMEGLREMAVELEAGIELADAGLTELRSAPQPVRQKRSYRTSIHDQVVGYIRDNPGCSARQVVEALNISHGSITQKIADGSIKRTGGRGSYALFV
jgi:uncharacterized coiled-coil protein SlyX